LWYPDYIFPDGAPGFARLRQKLGLAPQPQLYVLSGAGSIDGSHRALQDGGIVLTTRRGTARLAEARTIIIDEDPISPAAILRAVAHPRVLVEGGPSLIAQLVAAGAVDELF